MTTRGRSRRTTTTIRDQWIQYLRASVTETAANTFTQTTINSPVVLSQGYVIEMHTLEFDHDVAAVGELSATDDELVHRVQLTKTSQTALLRVNNPDLIANWFEQYLSPAARTAEKAPVWSKTYSGQRLWTFTQPVLLPFDELFLSMQGAGEAAARQSTMRLGFKTVRLGTQQLVELIQSIT